MKSLFIYNMNNFAAIYQKHRIKEKKKRSQKHHHHKFSIGLETSFSLTIKLNEFWDEYLFVQKSLMKVFFFFFFAWLVIWVQKKALTEKVMAMNILKTWGKTLSQTSTSLAKRLRILPSGVTSKNVIGRRRTAANKIVCIMFAAAIVPSENVIDTMHWARTIEYQNDGKTNKLKLEIDDEYSAANRLMDNELLMSFAYLKSSHRQRQVICKVITSFLMKENSLLTLWNWSNHNQIAPRTVK